MKKILFTFVAALFSTFMIAQNELGLRIGGHFNNTRVDGIATSLTPDTKMFEGFTAGAYYNIELLNGFSFSPGINYTQKGFVIDEGLGIDFLGADLPLGVRAETKIDYIEVPALFRYTINKGLGEFYFEAGPTIGYAVDGEVRTKARAILDFNIATIDLNLRQEIYNRLELSAQVGIGTAVKAGSGKIFANLRYQHGFSDMIDNPTIDIKLKNNGVNFGVGYAFTFGNRPSIVPLRV